MSATSRNSESWMGLAVLMAALAAIACGAPDGATSDKAAAGHRDGPGAGADADDMAFDFQLNDLEGQVVRLSDSKGRLRLLDFWATWCAPCREEIPMLNDLHEIYASQGLEILAISDSAESANDVAQFVEDYEVVYRNLIGTDEVTSAYPIVGLPTAFLIDGEGKIVKRYFGPKPRKVLEGKIRELLELPPET